MCACVCASAREGEGERERKREEEEEGGRGKGGGLAKKGIQIISLARARTLALCTPSVRAHARMPFLFERLKHSSAAGRWVSDVNTLPFNLLLCFSAMCQHSSTHSPTHRTSPPSVQRTGYSCTHTTCNAALVARIFTFYFYVLLALSIS